MMHHITVIETVSEFTALAPAWQDLLQRSGESRLNLDHHWLLTWLQHFPAKRLLIILLHTEEGELLAAAPFLIKRTEAGLARRMLRRVQFIGTDPSIYDSTDILCSPAIDRNLVLQEIAMVLLQRKPQWDMLDLRFVLNRNDLDVLLQLLSAKTVGAEIINEMSLPVLTLPETVEAYEASRNRSFRRDLNRIFNRLNREFPQQPLRLVFHEPSAQTGERMDAFFTDHEQFWLERGMKTESVRFPGVRPFYKAIHQYYYDKRPPHGRFHFSDLMLGDMTLGRQFTFWQGQDYLGYQAIYNPDFKAVRPGVLHIDALIKDVISHGGRAFSFGRGDEPYKGQWTKSLYPLWNLTLFQSSTAQWLWQVDTTLKTIKQSLQPNKKSQDVPSEVQTEETSVTQAQASLAQPESESEKVLEKV